MQWLVLALVATLMSEHRTGFMRHLYRASAVGGYLIFYIMALHELAGWMVHHGVRLP